MNKRSSDDDDPSRQKPSRPTLYFKDGIPSLKDEDNIQMFLERTTLDSDSLPSYFGMQPNGTFFYKPLVRLSQD